MVRGKSSSPQANELHRRQDGDPDPLLGMLEPCPAPAWVGRVDRRRGSSRHSLKLTSAIKQIHRRELDETREQAAKLHTL